MFKPQTKWIPCSLISPWHLVHSSYTLLTTHAKQPVYLLPLNRPGTSEGLDCVLLTFSSPTSSTRFGAHLVLPKLQYLWPPHAKSWLFGKGSDARRDWGQEEKGTTEDEMAGWNHPLDGHESEQTPGVGDGQGGLACCDSWGRKESDTTERLNWTEQLLVCWVDLWTVEQTREEH